MREKLCALQRLFVGETAESQDWDTFFMWKGDKREVP